MKSKNDVCDRCEGIGTLAAPPGVEGDIPGYRPAREASEEHGAIYTRACPKCAGEGTVRRSGDAHTRDRLMEIAGLPPGAKGASVRGRRESCESRWYALLFAGSLPLPLARTSQIAAFEVFSIFGKTGKS